MYRETWLRAVLVIPIVLVVHMFDWTLWRTAAANVLLLCLHCLGVSAARLTPDTLASAGRFFRIEISCTLIDALLASIPLLWEWGDSAIQNLSFLAVYMAGWSMLNIVRVAFGFVLLAHGVPWWLGHQVVAGLFYFALFCWIAHRRNWAIFRPDNGVHHEAISSF